MTVTPLHDRVIVQRIDDGEQNVGGIIIPDTAKEKPQQGTVIAVGSGATQRRCTMIIRENLDERQRRLLHLLTALFEQQPFLDTSRAAAVYPRLRADLIAAGATGSDFECLTEHLIGLVIEHGSALSTQETWRALLDLISTGFARRGFSALVERGVLVAVDFAAPPTKH